jgi:hypothetical protein
MTDSDRHAVLDRLEARLANEVGFVSYDLARSTAPRKPSRRPSGRGLGSGHNEDAPKVTDLRRQRLALCRSPRRGPGFAADIRALSEHTGIDMSDLERFFRRLDEGGYSVGAPTTADLGLDRDAKGPETPSEAVQIVCAGGGPNCHH